MHWSRAWRNATAWSVSRVPAACTRATPAASWAVLGASIPASSGEFSDKGEHQWVQGSELVLFDMVARAGEEGGKGVWNMAGMAMSMPC